MGKAARALIFENGKLLVMHRNKHGDEYFTLVGGRANDDESLEDALKREVMEETGLEVLRCRLVFIEEHPAPYNEQYIYYCVIAPHGEVAIQETSEEGYMNKLDINTHTPLWADLSGFSKLAFRTPQLQSAIVEALKTGFPEEPRKL